MEFKKDKPYVESKMFRDESTGYTCNIVMKPCGEVEWHFAMYMTGKDVQKFKSNMRDEIEEWRKEAKAKLNKPKKKRRTSKKKKESK